ncbi:MAG: hypothetical protein ACYC9K_12930 [Sulfuricaulis sp.]
MESILTSWLWKLLAWLPGFLLGLVFTPSRYAKLIKIDLRPRHDPVTLNFGEIPYVTIYLQVTNRSPFTVELDRLHLELTYGSGLANLYYLERTKIKSGSTTDFFVRNELSDAFAVNGSKHIENNRCTLDVKAEFNSRISSFGVRTGQLEGINPRVVNVRKNVS